MAWNSLDNELNRVLLQIAGDKYRDYVKAYRCWKAVVGELLAEKSFPIRFENKVLYVGVRNSSWMQELSLLKKSLITKYRVEYNIEIKEIVLLIKS